MAHRVARVVIQERMPTQTVTRAAESDLEPSEIYDVLAEASNIPKWAPAFADRIERIDETHYRVAKDNARFNMEVILHRSAGTVDIVREMADNRRGGAYLRVTPRPLGGSSITMTVPIGPSVDESSVAATVDRELTEVIGLARLHGAKA